MYSQKLYKTLRSLLVISLLLFLGGCWDNKDINHRALPIVMGISKSNERFTVYLHIPDPQRDGIKSRVVSGTGNTISEIVDRISTNLESKIDLLHLKIILLEKNYAEQGVNESISSFMRSREISAKTKVVISNNNLDQFFSKLNTDTKGGRNMLLLYDFFEENAGWNPQISETHIWEIYRSIYSYTHDVAIPIVKLGTSTFIEYMGSAVIKSGKMVGLITPDETLLLNAFLGLSTQGKIETMNHSTVLIVSDSTSHKSFMEGNKPILNSQINLKVSILETKSNATTAVIKKELETVLTERFNHMLLKIQKKEADILGLGQFFRGQLSRDRLAHWRSDYFPNMKVNLKVRTIIQNEGNLKSENG
jgi:Ger(x)C family germination protein